MKQSLKENGGLPASILWTLAIVAGISVANLYYNQPLLEEMLKQNIGGATILESTGMMRVLDGDHNIDDLPVLGVLRHLCNPERKRSKTIFTLLKSEQIPQMIEIINKVTGGLDKPDTGICFALPTTFVEGVNKNK